ncbi:5'-methylthioadenosine/S-adenosylhomocysteine nucleosidase [Oceanobacillus alkalisoli]|uniref:5'-methylthioadenosine/S-adenosylhomocysteine nucleosidase n=1 Tax=Oceanobacillus alkalisoli TaxID=2925113 RepID=UPI001EF0DEA8|nr:5'-methylthioadenosine/S-adenosylhomocysteine nucleosidase [Oceanobacillus alkalisoli]MCF3941838.1 5'-methylthioadenosine/S-adenosylhomocysteine nucleosidase [Oceanobacillus alkalisoli]MCG5103118.1 5'-methylthioadenosine/S-adenosylhomocysteine nucleosidase [Oceanobacillus alkalisoli]
MIGIIGAMDEEIAYLLGNMDDRIEITVAGCRFIQGELLGKEIVLLKSGIGKVNAAMGTTIMMERFHPDFIINTGSAGGFSDNLQVGDLVISNEVVHHDVDVTAFDYSYGQVPGLPATFQADERLVHLTADTVKGLGINFEIGLIATGDSFMEDEGKVNTARSNFPEMIASEMEAAAIAQVCAQYEVPFVVIRALSDIAGKDSSVSFDAFLKTAAKNASELIMRVVKTI